MWHVEEAAGMVAKGFFLKVFLNSGIQAWPAAAMHV